MSLSMKSKEIVSVDSSSSSSSPSPSSPTTSPSSSPSPIADNKIEIMFDECHWYDIPCPHPSCYAKNIRFASHQKFKLHHEQFHCPRGENGDINRAKGSLRWQCPVITTRIRHGQEITQQCNKVSNSWYNYAGHITSHQEIGHGWGCALKPAGKRKKTNVKRSIYNPKTGKIIKQTVCGKRTSTKHHLLAHMANVHKAYHVIDTNARQYTKKKGRKKANKACTNKAIILGKKRKFIDITSDDNDAVFLHENTKNTSLLQMPLPQFNKIQTHNTPITIPTLQTIPQFPNLFNVNVNHNHALPPLLLNNLFTIQTPPTKKMRFNQPQTRKQRRINHTDKEQFDFLALLCKAADIHKGCIKCAVMDDISCNEEDDNDLEASLPSLSTYNGSINSTSSNVSPSTFNDDSNGSLTVNNTLSLPKLPIIFPNFHDSQAIITNNVPFTFDLNQLCRANKTNSNRVITTAIPSLPTMTAFKIN